MAKHAIAGLLALTLSMGSLGLPAAPARAQEPATPESSRQPDDAKPRSRHGPIRKAGDVGMILNPALGGVIALSEDDPDGLRQLARGCGITVAATSVLKLIFDRTWLGERPDGNRNSFPSGHTSSAMCGAAFVHYRYQDNRYTVPLGAVGTFVAYSRMWARKHHLRDVVAGTVLAMVSAHNTTHHRSGNEEGRRPPSPAPALALAQTWDAPVVMGTHLLLFERGASDPEAELALDALEPGLRGGLAFGTRRAPDVEPQMYLGLRFDGVF